MFCCWCGNLEVNPGLLDNQRHGKGQDMSKLCVPVQKIAVLERGHHDILEKF